MFRKAVSVGAVALLQSCLAAPAELQERACPHDNLYRCFVDARYSTFASAYCSGLSTFTSTVATVTATVTETALTTTVTASTETDSFSLTSTVYTATVPSATVTVTYGQPLAKRVVASSATTSLSLPACAATYAAARLTSACACINVPAPTVSVTYTATTQTVTSTPTQLVTSTTSETTFLSTVSTATTSGVSTVLVCPTSTPNLIGNGGFDGGSTSGWQLQTTDSSAWSFSTPQISGYDGQNTYVAQLRQSSNSGFGNIQYRGFSIQNGINYKVGVMVKASSWPSATSFSNLEIDVCSLTGGPCSTTNALSGGQLVGNGWAKFEFAFTARSNGAGYLNLYASRNGANPTYWFDNVSFMINC